MPKCSKAGKRKRDKLMPHTPIDLSNKYILLTRAVSVVFPKYVESTLAARA